MLQGCAGPSGGQVEARLAELAAGRRAPPEPQPSPAAALPGGGLGDVDAHPCRSITSTRRRRAPQCARGRRERDQFPRESGWTPENLCAVAACTYPPGCGAAGRIGEHSGLSRTPDVVQGERGGVLDASRGDLFPCLDTVIAYKLLFGIYSGIVPDGIDDLRVADDIDWAGDSTILLSYVKGRTAAESLNLPRNAVRLLEQWLAHSALLRSLVAPTDRDRLWLGLSQPGQPWPDSRRSTASCCNAGCCGTASSASTVSR